MLKDSKKIGILIAIIYEIISFIIIISFWTFLFGINYHSPNLQINSGMPMNNWLMTTSLLITMVGICVSFVLIKIPKYINYYTLSFLSIIITLSPMFIMFEREPYWWLICWEIFVLLPILMMFYDLIKLELGKYKDKKKTKNINNDQDDGESSYINNEPTISEVQQD